jgi:lipid-binding SYLF domain-containing protein
VLDALANSQSGIPTDLLNNSECVIILPSVKKGGFIIAGQYGRGLMTCRTGEKFDGPWSAPIMMRSPVVAVSAFRLVERPSTTSSWYSTIRVHAQL